MMVLSCSKLLNQKQKEKSVPQTFSKMILSCFIKISQEQAHKIFYVKEDSIPLKLEEIYELLNINNLNDISEEKLKYNEDLINKYLKEIESPNERNLEEVDNDDKDANKDNQADDNKDDLNINDDAENANDNNDNDNEFNDMDNDDSNDYGEDMMIMMTTMMIIMDMVIIAMKIILMMIIQIIMIIRNIMIMTINLGEF